MSKPRRGLGDSLPTFVDDMLLAIDRCTGHGPLYKESVYSCANARTSARRCVANPNRDALNAFCESLLALKDVVETAQFQDLTQVRMQLTGYVSDNAKTAEFMMLPVMNIAIEQQLFRSSPRSNMLSAWNDSSSAVFDIDAAEDEHKRRAILGQTGNPLYGKDRDELSASVIDNYFTGHPLRNVGWTPGGANILRFTSHNDAIIYVKNDSLDHLTFCDITIVGPSTESSTAREGKSRSSNTEVCLHRASGISVPGVTMSSASHSSARKDDWDAVTITGVQWILIDLPKLVKVLEALAAGGMSISTLEKKLRGIHASLEQHASKLHPGTSGVNGNALARVNAMLMSHKACFVTQEEVGLNVASRLTRVENPSEMTDANIDKQRQRGRTGQVKGAYTEAFDKGALKVLVVYLDMHSTAEKTQPGSSRDEMHLSANTAEGWVRVKHDDPTHKNTIGASLSEAEQAIVKERTAKERKSNFEAMARETERMAYTTDDSAAEQTRVLEASAQLASYVSEVGAKISMYLSVLNDVNNARNQLITYSTWLDAPSRERVMKIWNTDSRLKELMLSVNPDADLRPLTLDDMTGEKVIKKVENKNYITQ